jgi:DNA-binding protein HU-beta
MAAKKVTAAEAPKKAVKAAPAARATPAAAAKTKASAKVVAPPASATTVTLKHLASELADRHELLKKQADTLMTDVVALLVGHLKSGDRLRIGGLGILEVKSRPERMGRNPATGEAIQIKASRKIAFRAAKELKESI